MASCPFLRHCGDLDCCYGLATVNPEIGDMIDHSIMRLVPRIQCSIQHLSGTENHLGFRRWSLLQASEDVGLHSESQSG